jgi:hypothetical protein
MVESAALDGVWAREDGVPREVAFTVACVARACVQFTGASGGASGGGSGGGINGGGGGGVAGGAAMYGGGLMGSTEELEQRIEKVDLQIKDMSRNVAKKLSLMIDLMMSLSDQVGSVSGVPSASRGNGSQLMGRIDANPAIMPPLR